MKQQKLDNLGAQKKSFALATSEIQGLVEFVERSVENATDEEFMSLQQYIHEQIQEQCAKHECIDLVPAEVANVSVRMACAEGISDLCQKNADIIVLRVDPTKCTAEGPGTKVAEVSKSAQFTFHTVYQNGQLCREMQVVEAELKSVVNDSVGHAKVASKGRGIYEVTYTLEVRGRHSLIFKVNGTQLAGSPFQVFAKIHPTQLGEPVRVVEEVTKPWGIAVNSKQQLVIAEVHGKKITIFDREGEKVRTITSEKVSLPVGVAVDKDDNIYVSDFDNSSILKFSNEGNLMKVVGRKGTQPGEFSDVGLIKVINDKLYVCDRGNNRVQILNTELDYVDSFGCYGDGDGQFNRPLDIAQDGAGNLYVSDSYNNRVQVFDCKKQFLSTFKKKGAASEQIKFPSGICVGSEFVYVCDKGNKCVSVFKTSGEFVTSFGQFSVPGGIVVDDDGFVYVSDYEYAGKVYIL